MFKKHQVVEWPLNTENCHHGIPLSNGVMGALIWFQTDSIRITLNRADYWDHRGSTPFSEECSYEYIKQHLKQGDFEQIRKLFPTVYHNGYPLLPTRLPMGRFELQLLPNVIIGSASLDLDAGEARIRLTREEHTCELTITLLMDAHAVVCGSSGFETEGFIRGIQPVSAYDFPDVKSYYDTRGFGPHRYVKDGTVCGWVQVLPNDPACAVVALSHDGKHFFASAYGDGAEFALEAAKQVLEACLNLAYEDLVKQTRTVWQQLSKQTARIEIGDPELETMYRLGIYRMHGNTMPGRLGPTLQGPWAEEFRMTPWSGDYHFNINVQLMSLPAYASNHLDCLMPLFNLIADWEPKLAERARIFAGTKDGLMLSHAVDDRGNPIGGMWTGTIDHGNTSWVAQLMWLYYRYSMDEEFLMKHVYPFMCKAMNVYLHMLEWDGNQYSVPVSVSPEYGGDGKDALGRNSTFFLVNIHFLCEKILETARRNGIDQEYIGQIAHIQSHLPPFTTVKWQELEYSGPNPICNEELALWEGKPLEVSHRHHSHMAGIYPFDMLDYKDERTREIIDNTYRTWVDKGMGRWSGWSMPWASMIHGRLLKKDMAYFTLKLLAEYFCMPGYAARHNARYEGASSFVGGDIMQLDAAISAAAAILELFVQNVRGHIRVFASLPDRFQDAAFSGIRAEGAFLISGKKSGGAVEYIEVFSEKGSVLNLDHPFTTGVRISREDGAVTMFGTVKIETKAGERIVLTPWEGRDAAKSGL